MHCLVCKSENTEYIKTCENPWNIGETLRLYLCRDCNTIFWNPLPKENYAELLGYPGDKFYIEYDAGIPFMASLLYSVKKFRFRSMLDIGSGLGFLMDIADEMLNIEQKMGIEPSYNKRMRLFNYDMINGYFPEDLKGKDKFDLIISCEVLEHTYNPVEFLKNIIFYLNNNGIAIITTPNADAYFYEEENEKFAIIDPGRHTVIFSRKSMWMVFDELDIKYKLFHSEGKSGEKTHILFLSRDKTILDRITYLFPTRSEVLKFSEEYLSNKIRKFQQNSLLFFGFLSRLIEVRTNMEKFEETEDLIEAMLESLHDYYHIDLSKIYYLIEKINKIPNKSLDEFIAVYPGFLGKFLYFYGLWLLKYKRDFSGSYKIFNNAAIILKTEQQFPRFFANNGLLELANRYVIGSRERRLKLDYYRTLDLLLPFGSKRREVAKSIRNKIRSIRRKI